MAEQLTVWERIKNGGKKVVDGLLSSVLWATALFTGSYFAGKIAKDEKWDLLRVAKAVEVENPNEAIANVGRLAMIPLGGGAALNFLFGFTGFGAAPAPADQPNGQPGVQTQLPRPQPTTQPTGRVEP